MEKMVVQAAHPRPRIRMAEALNPGDFTRVRMDWRSSASMSPTQAREAPPEPAENVWGRQQSMSAIGTAVPLTDGLDRGLALPFGGAVPWNPACAAFDNM